MGNNNPKAEEKVGPGSSTNIFFSLSIRKGKIVIQIKKILFQAEIVRDIEVCGVDIVNE